MTLARYLVGIDPGVDTGFAIWDRQHKAFDEVSTVRLHEALFRIYFLRPQVEVRFEDARRRRWYGAAGHEVLQGVGSVKRDCSVLQEFLTDRQIAFQALHPQKGLTKWTAARFAATTGWTARTSVHARDAALLVWRA